MSERRRRLSLSEMKITHNKDSDNLTVRRKGVRVRGIQGVHERIFFLLDSKGTVAGAGITEISRGMSTDEYKNLQKQALEAK